MNRFLGLKLDAQCASWAVAHTSSLIGHNFSWLARLLSTFCLDVKTSRTCLSCRFSTSSFSEAEACSEQRQQREEQKGSVRLLLLRLGFVKPEFLGLSRTTATCRTHRRSTVFAEGAPSSRCEALQQPRATMPRCVGYAAELEQRAHVNRDSRLHGEGRRCGTRNPAGQDREPGFPFLEPESSKRNRKLRVSCLLQNWRMVNQWISTSSEFCKRLCVS